MIKPFKKIKNNRKTQILIVIIILFVCVCAGIFWYIRTNPVMPQLTIYFLNDVKLPEKDQKVLIFSPHPDDETLACGGYIIESIKRGAEVKIVLVTDGNRRSLKDLRYLEFEAATNILGVLVNNLIFLNYPDGNLIQEDQVELEKNFRSRIDSFNPDIVLYPHPNDTHKDHAITSKIVEKILEQSPNKKIAYKYLVHHPLYPYPKKYTPDLYTMPPISLITFDGGWERLMLSEETKNLKQKVLKSYQSQLKNPLLKNLLESFIRENELFAVESYPD
ncbi:MAG TPA: PIG-L family deacetylase [Candidatus Atribacteria bacterium]|nr:PIG-L family deacetylase [Candidatus Atribacteria bacterium]